MNGLTLSEFLTPLVFAGIAFVITAVLQVFKKYTLPNIGYYHRTHGRDETFLIRNFDATRYHQTLSVEVLGEQLDYVTVQAGPWCQSTLEGKSPPLRVDFTGVPEDAVFVIRARARVGEVKLRLHPDSKLVPRHSFDAPLESFTFWRRIAYYAARYLSGLGMFLAVFIGSIWFLGRYGRAADVHGGDPISQGDIIICVLGAVVSLMAFFLVVPFNGKRTLGGYDGAPIEQGHGHALGVCWPDEASVIAALDASLGIQRKIEPRQIAPSGITASTVEPTPPEPPAPLRAAVAPSPPVPLPPPITATR